ncbi:RNase H family protein [Virgibacillus salexigens]|uniref:Ribonuclease H n=1 Tax=Virgibacillus massiliensis TaxID=1462526 RepID=A0A024QIT3_9BACI|nr:RNase H family protein [Virgibacillus massiliensis]CDQ41866.1 Ribonuclease H [Virgibacillus massiliensis]
MSKTDFDKLRIDMWVSGTADKEGNGGYSALLYSQINQTPFKKTIGGYATDTTITRMTLKAIVEGLTCIKSKSFIHIYTSLPQISVGLNKNMYVWERNDWRRKDGQFLKHADLWQQVFELLDEKSLSYRVKLERPFPSQDNHLYVIHMASKYTMQAKKHLHEVAVSS